MMARGEAIGVLAIARRGVPTEAEERLLTRISEELSLTLANLRLRASLRHLSVRDPLTGLFNRRYMEETFERELSRSQRNGQALSVVVVEFRRGDSVKSNRGASGKSRQHLCASVHCLPGGKRRMVLDGFDELSNLSRVVRIEGHGNPSHHSRRVRPVQVFLASTSDEVNARLRHGLKLGQVLVQNLDLFDA